MDTWQSLLRWLKTAAREHRLPLLILFARLN
jgi:hypothetical protein